MQPVKQRGVSLQLTSAVLTPMRRAHDLPILIGEPFNVTAERNQDARSWDSNIRCQLGNNRPGAVQAWKIGENKLPIKNRQQKSSVFLGKTKTRGKTSCCFF